MIFTTQLVLWLVICTAGMFTAFFALRFRVLVLKSVRSTGQDADLVDGARQSCSVAVWNFLGWFGVFSLGLLAFADKPTPELVDEITVLEHVIGWMLIASVAVWAYMTYNVYAYTLKRWWESPISSRTTTVEHPRLDG
jgi:hypothetical protein